MEAVTDQSRDKMLEVIFHSNKIEGNALTKGETESLLAADNHKRTLSAAEREAKNLETAYTWMLDHVQSGAETPESFIRQLNKLVMHGLSAHGGEYRTGPISISGMDFTPPPAASVSAFMKDLSEEMRNEVRGRSPLECAVAFHTKLVFIHPFTDGNGRTARLLMNALLSLRGLPVVVINYADRERYLDCLKESNQGDLSALVEFTIECFNEQLTEFEVATNASAEGLTTKPSVATETSDETNDPIDAVLEAAGIKEIDDPLTAVLTSKALERRKAIVAEFEAWRQSMLVVPAELSAIVDEVNSSDLCQQVGYRLRLHNYDVLTFEKYADITGGKRVTRTWFVGVDIDGPESRERLMFFFNGAGGHLRRTGSSSSVSLSVSRFDGTRFVRLTLEPIGLREIGYRKGTLMFVSRDGTAEEGSVRRHLRVFVADVIKTYL
jgi:fido (protein-threonine AMPylation protein)